MAEIMKLRNKAPQMTARQMSASCVKELNSVDHGNLACIPFSQALLKHSSLVCLKQKKVEDAAKLSLHSHELGLRHRINHRYRMNVSGMRLEMQSKPSEEVPSETKFQEKFLQQDLPDIAEVLETIPEEWTVVQLTSLPTKENCFRHYGGTKKPLASPDVLIGRHSKSLQHPVIARVVPSSNNPKADGTTTVFGMLKELLEDNRRVNETLRADKESYWKKRSDHHEKMQTALCNAMLEEEVSSLQRYLLRFEWRICNREVIRAIELEYLGPWRHLLIGEAVLDDCLKSEFTDAANELNGFSIGSNEAKLIVNAMPYLTYSDLISLLPKQLVRSELKIWMSKYDKVKMALKSAKRNPVILILDKVTQTLPWESLHCLQRQSTTRLPCLSLLKLLVDRHKNHKIGVLPLDGRSVCISPLKSYYLLNPAGDLEKVQERLEVIVKRIWGSEGNVQRAPRAETLLEKLKTKEVFVYLGHGSGTQFVGGEMIGRSFVKAAATLFGCSSARMPQPGPRVDPMGTVVHYLIAGSPVCVGMLWEVTDVDCDKMTVRFWQQWLGDRFPKLDETAIVNTAKYIDYSYKCAAESDLATCVALARGAAISYLNRCALVVYGIPARSGVE